VNEDSELQAAQREFMRMAEDLEAAMSQGGNVHVACSFCGRSKAEVGALVAGLHAAICDRCVVEAQKVIDGK